MSCRCAGMQQCELCASIDPKYVDSIARQKRVRAAALPGDDATAASLRVDLNEAKRRAELAEGKLATIQRTLDVLKAEDGDAPIDNDVLRAILGG